MPFISSHVQCGSLGGFFFFPDSHDVSMFTCLTLVMTFSSHSCSPSVINTRSLSSPTKFQSICSLYGINPGVPPTPKTEPHCVPLLLLCIKSSFWKKYHRVGNNIKKWCIEIKSSPLEIFIKPKRSKLFICISAVLLPYTKTFHWHLLLLRDVISLVSFQIPPFLSLIKAIYLFMGGFKKEKV